MRIMSTKAMVATFVEFFAEKAHQDSKKKSMAKLKTNHMRGLPR